jgi:basic membrane lipoprotein Med (substrate-binding protein (PBP1-ABC) superfamily)
LIAGFKQGIDYANSNYTINVTLLPDQYVGSYNDSATAEALAVEMFNPINGNATVVFAPVRASMPGIRNALFYANSSWFGETNREPLVIAAEGDQDYLGLPNIETRAGNSWIITSVVPRSDLAVYRAINQTLWDQFEGEALIYDLSRSGDDLETPGVILTNSDFINSQWTPRALFDEIESLRLLIISGDIPVSETYPP